MSKTIGNGLNLNNTKIENLAAPTNPNDAARKADIDSAVEGTNWKDSVRVSTQGNLNLSSPGANIDGVVMAQGDRVLVRNQSSAPENGIYIFDSDVTAMVRSNDASTGDELEQAIVTVEEGTDAGASYRQTQVNFTIDVGDCLWTSFGTSVPSASESTEGKIEIATQPETDAGSDDARAITPLKLANWSGRKRKATGTIGDAAATQFDISHNFGTRDVNVEIYRNSSPWDSILTDISRPDNNTVRVNFAVAPASNEFAYSIIA